MRRRRALALAGSLGTSALAGCVARVEDAIRYHCPGETVVNTNVPARRWLVRRTDREGPQGEETDDPPTVAFDDGESSVVVRGVFRGATFRNREHTILVDRLHYDSLEGLLEIRLVRRRCRSAGSPAMVYTPYEIRVLFPTSDFERGAPARVCAQEHTGEDAQRTCVDR